MSLRSDGCESALRGPCLKELRLVPNTLRRCYCSTVVTYKCDSTLQMSQLCFVRTLSHVILFRTTNGMDAVAAAKPQIATPTAKFLWRTVVNRFLIARRPPAKVANLPEGTGSLLRGFERVPAAFFGEPICEATTGRSLNVVPSPLHVHRRAT